MWDRWFGLWILTNKENQEVHYESSVLLCKYVTLWTAIPSFVDGFCLRCFAITDENYLNVRPHIMLIKSTDACVHTCTFLDCQWCCFVEQSAYFTLTLVKVGVTLQSYTICMLYDMTSVSLLLYVCTGRVTGVTLPPPRHIHHPYTTEDTWWISHCHGNVKYN